MSDSEGLGARRPSLAANTIAQSAPVLITYLAGLASAPIVLASLGLRAFGIWALTGALAQYGGLLNLGIGQALARFVAVYDAAGDRRALGQTLALGLLSVPAVAVPLAAASWFAAAPLAHALHGIGVGAMRDVLLSSVTMVACALLTGALSAYPVGLRRMIRPNAALSVGALLNLIFSVVAALSSTRLVVYALANAAASVLTVAVVAVAVLSLEPRMQLRRPTRALAREILGFSLKDQLVVVSNLVNFQTDKIVIALFVGPAAAGAYELANRVAAAARLAGLYGTSALLPTVAAELVKTTREVLVAGYIRLTARVATITTPLLVLTIALSPIVLHAWLGVSPRYGPLVLAALSVAYIVNSTTAVGYAYLNATGHPGLSARANVAAAAANIALTVVLGELFGIRGILAGTVIALTAGAVYQVLLTHRLFTIPLRSYCTAIAPSLLLAVGLGAPATAVAELAHPLARGEQAAVCVAITACYALVYLAAAGYRDLLPRSLSSRLPLIRDRLT
ncbi:MAG: polysaccharide biosynthesis C-terminal domain-containing protein [Solirubrobacteraceae bacterium]